MGRNEKAGPYWYFKDGKLVSGPDPRRCRQSRRADALPDGHARHQTPDHQGPARGMDARRRRAYSEVRGPGENMDVLATR